MNQKLTPELRAEIIKRLREKTATRKELAYEYDVSYQTITHIWLRNAKKGEPHGTRPDFDE